MQEFYVELIRTKFNVIQVYVFGSFAKGTNHKDSDIDIAIVVGDVPDIIDAQFEMMKLRRKVDLRIEPHPFDATDFTNENPVVSEIQKYGIIIW